MLLSPTKTKKLSSLTQPLEEKPKHLHEYVRSSKNKNIYKCVSPDCSHYQEKEYLEGKRAICHKCKSEMIIQKTQLNNKVPVCLMCTKSGKGKQVQKVKDFLESILPGIQV